MPQTTLQAIRSSDAWLRVALSKNSAVLSTTIDTDREVWSALEYYSENEEVGLDLIQTRGILPQSLHQEIFKYFQAFVRQSKSYFYSAKSLHYRSSSLLYYYCFLNLVKAYLLLKHPNIVMGRSANAVVHGLKYRTNTINTDFLLELVTVDRGIFPMFYEAMTGQAISTGRSSTLNIVKLLCYCTDISYQYEIAGFGERQILPSIATFALNQTTHESWSFLGIPAINHLLDPFLSQHPAFLSIFQEVGFPSTPLARIGFNQMFDMSSHDLHQFRFFQDIVPVQMIGNSLVPPVLFDKIVDALKPNFSFHYFDENVNFDLSIPYQDPSISVLIPMNEAIAIYVAMFYLSSLVRYRPNYLESLLNHKPAWLIEGFVNSTPETFLRIIVSKIVERDLIFRRR